MATFSSSLWQAYYSDTAHLPKNAAGNYNEDAFQALDAIIGLADQYAIKLLMPFTDNWQYIEGLQQVHFISTILEFVKWRHLVTDVVYIRATSSSRKTMVCLFWLDG